MSGATGSGQDVQTGRTNREEGRTIFWAQVPPGQANFNGPAVLILEVAKDAEDPDDYENGGDFIPSNQFHGLIASGWSGGGASNPGGTTGASGVIGRGGRTQGSGVVGLGGGTPEPDVSSGINENGGAGGIGVHGLGGPGPHSYGFIPDDTPPGAGVVGQGGIQDAFQNRAQLPHAAGVIGIAGGTGENTDLLPSHPLTATGGVGVYAQGAEARVSMVAPLDKDGNPTSGPNVPSGPLAPGAGLLGRGGVPIPLRGPVAAGVIGLAGGTTPVPGIDETGDSGVYGAGPTGVIGKGNSGPGIHGFGNVDGSRGGQFESTNSAQVQLVPHATEKPPPTTESVTPQAIKVDRERGGELPRDGQGGDLLALMDDQRQCTLWFCVKGPEGAPARWAQVLLGQTFPGNA